MPSAPPDRFRIAPTPSGFLHEGNRLNFRHIAQLRADAVGTLLLRIDDLDAGRKRPEFVAHIFRVLREEGILWDEGPRNEADFESAWSQRHRLPDYHALLDRLRDGGHLFACTCSRRTVDRCGCEGADLDFDAPDTTWRLRSYRRSADPGLTILRQKNGLPAYHIASVSDDIRFGITHIVRGEDLRPSTDLQLDIARRLGLEAFLRATFIHHPLLMGPDGRKLSKSRT
jgi:glutamyl-tRNA synthetase